MTDLHGQAAPEDLQPTVGACYKNGWQQLWNNLIELLLIALIGFVAHLPESLGSLAEEETGLAAALPGLFTMAYTALVSWPLGYGISYAYLRAARGDELKVKHILAVLGNYWNAVLANLLVALIVCIGFVVLIVPGIVFLCRLSFVSYLVVERQLDAIAAVKESWRLTSGHGLTIFLMGLLAILLAIVGLMLVGVGIIAATLWAGLAWATLYHIVSTEDEEQTAIAPEGAAGLA